MYLPFDENADKPCFKEQVKSPQTNESDFVLYYTHQCPYTAKYVPLIESIAKDKGLEFKSVCFKNAEEAQNAPLAFTTYSLFYNGKFVTHEILSEKKFEKVLAELGL